VKQVLYITAPILNPQMLTRLLGIGFILHFLQMVYDMFLTFSLSGLQNAYTSFDPGKDLFTVLLPVFALASLITGISLLAKPKYGIPLAMIRSALGIINFILIYVIGAGLSVALSGDITQIFPGWAEGEPFLFALGAYWPPVFFLITLILLTKTLAKLKSV
jgi:hypothetical protein